MKENTKNNISKNLLTNQKGMALLATLIFTFVLVSLGAALLTMTNNDAKMSTLQRESNRAFYLAESGVEKTFYNLNVDTGYDMLDWRPGDTSPIFHEGTTEEYFEVTIESIGDTTATPPEEANDRIKITSTGFVDKGKYSSGQRKIEVIAIIDFDREITYKHAILAEHVIHIQGNQPPPNIEGNIHSNDAIEIQGGFADDYEGTATTSGDNNMVYDEGELIEGFNFNLEEIPIPTINYDGTIEGDTYEDSLLAEAYAQQTAEGITHVHEETVVLGPGSFTEWTGVHYIKGGLIAKHDSEINIENGVIVVEGNVDIRFESVFEHTKTDDYESPFSALALIATGDITLHSTSSILNGFDESINISGVVQSIEKDGTSNGTIDFRNGSTIEGSVIANTVLMHSATNIIYDEEGLNSTTSQGDGFYKKTSWQEVY
jgi:hypothetical protein